MFRFGRGCVERDLAAARRREPVRPDPATSKIVGGEFPDRQPPGKTGGERVRRVMVLMPALEGRDPQRLGAAARDRTVQVGCRPVEIEAQMAGRRLAEEHRFQP